MILAADTDIWRFQAHPEVWLLIAGAVALAWYAVRVIGPNAVEPGTPVVTRRNTVAYVAAIGALWVASDWPMHDVSEEYLYSAHMIQHLIISFVVPPLLLVATPEWLARLVMSSDGRAGVWIRRLSHPVAAGVTFNIVIAMTHLTYIVNTSVEVGPFHYAVHTVVFLASLMMWIPVVGPVPELRMGLAGQMVYLFLMSVIPTVPAGFLTFADGVLYDAYDHDVRLWGLDISADQQLAGFFMKIIGGMYLWTWIIVRFYQWSNATRGSTDLILVTDGAGDDPRGPDAAVGERPDVGAPPDLTFEDVQAEFEAAGPAPTEA